MVSRHSKMGICWKTSQLFKKRKPLSVSNGVMDIAGFTLSDLEDDDEEYFGKFEILCNCFECT